MGDKWDYYKPGPDPSSSDTDTSAWSPFDALFPFAGVCLVAAVGVVAWQLYTFLRFGSWPPFSVITVLQWCDVGWASFPRDWLGIHRVLLAFPLSLAFVVLGVGPLFAYMTWSERKT